jgi:hypothetical protein
MAKQRRREDADALIIQGLRSTHEAIGREFDETVANQKELKRQIAHLQKAHADLGARAGELAWLLAQLGDAVDAAAEGRLQVQLTDRPARLSRHGPAGFRAPILDILAERPEGPWSPEDVRRRLTLRGIVKTSKNVGQTMRNMVADGQLDRIGKRGAYRLPPK